MPKNDPEKIINSAKELKAVFRKFPRIAGRLAVNHFKASFKNQGFTDKTLNAWAKRKERRQRGKRKSRGRRKTLVSSGELRRSIRILNISSDSVTVGTNVIYASIHNEGGTINHPGGTPYIVIKDKESATAEAVFISNRKADEREAAGLYVKRTKPHKIPIPKRQFIGRSRVLDAAIIAKLEKEILKAL